ncbi:hypothetical protein Tco_1487342, partial [Tanacetum coccineum]
INKLAKEGLVDGLPLKVFTNEHNCVACNKGKQHKASYKSISAERLIIDTLQLLHIDLFGPTNIRSIDQKYYSLVVLRQAMSFMLLGTNAYFERNADFAEELAKLQRQEHEAKDAAARYGYLFSQTTADILSQAEAEIRNKGVSADRDPAGSVFAGSTFASSDPAGGHPAGPFQPAGSYDPAAMGDPAAQGDPAASTSVSADFIPVHADKSTLPPGKFLGSSENTKRFPVPSDVCKDQFSFGIFTSSSYDDDFHATLTNLAPDVEVNPVPTKRVNIIHPQSQILGDLASPVLTRSRAYKSKLKTTKCHFCC